MIRFEYTNTSNNIDCYKIYYNNKLVINIYNGIELGATRLLIKRDSKWLKISNLNVIHYADMYENIFFALVDYADVLEIKGYFVENQSYSKLFNRKII